MKVDGPIQLSPEDYETLLEALRNPPAPNARLRQLMGESEMKRIGQFTVLGFAIIGLTVVTVALAPIVIALADRPKEDNDGRP